MRNLKTYFFMIAIMVAGIASCSAGRKEAIGYVVEQALFGQEIDKLTIMDNDFIKYDFEFLARYRISHEFWWGADVGVCGYGLKANDLGWVGRPGTSVGPHYGLEKTGDMFERSGKIYQYSYLDAPNASHSRWDEEDMSAYVLERKPICEGRPKGYRFRIQLIDSSIFSIEKHIEEPKKLNRSWGLTWNEPRAEKRGNNSWLVSQGGRNEEKWYLRVADTNYYYVVSRAGVVPKEEVPDDLATPELRTIRAGFERMLDSFVIEPIKNSPMIGNTQGGNP